EDAAVVALRLRQSQLPEDAADVLLDRAAADEERRADGRIRAPLGHQREHVALALGQLLERAAACDELTHDLRVERRPARRHSPHGLDEIAYVRHALLEQIA